MRPDTDDYLKLFLDDTPMMDVRAPVEFARGTFPSADNRPILDDAQREAIGKRYKQQGQDEAIRLGLELATPEVRAERLRAWKEWIDAHPDGYLYCFRGGLRSRTTQAWLREQGIDYPLVKGGYKAMRRFLIDELERSAETLELWILAGMTGSGKTRVLLKTRHHVDLEGLANHRGSAFGRDVDDWQPQQIDFENALSIALLRHRHRHPGTPLWLEDEGRLIGRLIVPERLLERMREAPRVYLERSLPERVRIIREDYIADNWPGYRERYGDAARDKFGEFVLGNVDRIRKRLGGERHATLREWFGIALERLFEEDDASGFDAGIQLLLEHYYDPMYRYQLKTKPRNIVFSGSEDEVLAWSESRLAELKQAS